MYPVHTITSIESSAVKRESYEEVKHGLHPELLLTCQMSFAATAKKNRGASGSERRVKSACAADRARSWFESTVFTVKGPERVGDVVPASLGLGESQDRPRISDYFGFTIHDRLFWIYDTRFSGIRSTFKTDISGINDSFWMGPVRLEGAASQL